MLDIIAKVLYPICGLISLIVLVTDFDISFKEVIINVCWIVIGLASLML